MKKLIPILIITTLFAVGCKKSTKDNNENSESTEIVEYTPKDIKILLDSTLKLANFTWDSVIYLDDEKMSNIKRLLDEISYCEGSDEKKLKELNALHNEVKNIRYNQDNITSDLIDNYDKYQDQLISETIQLAESTPNIEAHPLAIELIEEITTADGMTFSKRGDYDIWAKKINKTLKDYPELVKELGAPYSNYRKLGIFGFEEE